MSPPAAAAGIVNRHRGHHGSPPAALPLGGVLLTLEDDEAAAERPRDRVKRRNQHHHRKRRNQRRRNKHKHKHHKKKGGKGGSQCGATGSLCDQHSDCCTNNCFNFVCAARATTCGSGEATRQCVPPARGCASESCCYGTAGCGETCCQLPANQCNPQDECCAPNCAGRQYGEDGCGAGGTCGNYPLRSTCDDETGQCSCVPQCQGKQCGPNGCGGNCGPCGEPKMCCGGRCTDVLDDGNNCGTCGHRCSTIGASDCMEGICCNIFPGDPCSATLPCCAGQCQNGTCCDTRGSSCNGRNEHCCSGVCDADGRCT